VPQNFERRKNLKIPIEQILVSKDNPRQNFDEEGLRRLGESIREHGQLQAIIVRPVLVKEKAVVQGYELVVGERRLRACALVGINEVEAEVRDVDDATAMELRLIENTQREDLSDAEKGDAVLALWANYDKYETIKDVAEAIKLPYGAVKDWTLQSKQISGNIRKLREHMLLNDYHLRKLAKYPHTTQEKLAQVIIKKKIPTTNVLDFTKLYDANPQRDLDEIADEVLGIKTVTIPKDKLPQEVLEKLNEEKKQLAKVQRIRKKPSKPITKEQVKEKLAEKKTDFKFVKAKITRGTGNAPPLKQQIKPTLIPNLNTPDYNLCKCATCSLFAKHCKGRCWT